MHWRRSGLLAITRGEKRDGHLPTLSTCRCMEAEDRIFFHLNRRVSVYSLPRSVRRERQLIGSDTDDVTILCMKLEQTIVESTAILPPAP